MLSPYGTMGQGGNVLEWEETDFDLVNGPLTLSNRGVRGGLWSGHPNGLSSSARLSLSPRYEDLSGFGFRVASIAVPEPSTLLLLGFGSLAVLWRRRGLCCALILAAAFFGLDGPCARADSAVAWGSTFRGALGNGIAVTTSVTPAPVSGMDSGVTAIAAGYQYSLGVQNGGAFAWGENISGQLGDGTQTNRSTPVPVSGLASGVTAVAASGFGNDHSLAIQNGALYAWGSNGVGQLGDGTTTRRLTPVPVTGMDIGVTAVAAGDSFSLAVKNGGLYAWGANTDGRLGDGTTTNRSTPVPVSAMASGITAIAAGNFHSLAVNDGGVYAWGQNVVGVLGNGTIGGFSSTPALVGGLENGATAVAAGSFHSLAVVNGAVFAWGENQHGLLGDDEFAGGISSTPVQVYPTILTNIVAVAAEGPQVHRDFALSADGSLWSWGNTIGGNPQHLLPPAGYKFTSIDAGRSHVVATLAAIPEPSTLVLVATSLVALTLAGRRRIA